MSRARRFTAAAVLFGLVIVLHWVGVTQLAALTRFGSEARDDRPQRLSVLFVRTLQQATPSAQEFAPMVALPPVPLAAPAPMALLDIPAVELAASAPQARRAEPAPDEPDPTPEPAPAVAAAPVPGPDLPAAPANAASAPAFEWPPSTRLRYVLTGNYRGPIDGTAQVEWLRDGSRYQVHLDVAIGLSFAPLISRQMSSDGELGSAGLMPRRYDERTRVLFGGPQSATLHFDGRLVRLADGRRVPQPPGVQDSVSQFVQLTWRFLLQPWLLQPGQVLEVPLALPRRVATWVYDVRGAEILDTPAGAVEAVHVQPRLGSRRGGELTADIWFAPSLQYLPVRILIRQNDESYVDLLIDRLPEQAIQPPPVSLPPVSLPLAR